MSSNGPTDVKDLVPAGLITAKAVLPVVDPKYTAVGESLRKNVPHEMQERRSSQRLTFKERKERL